MKLYQRLAFPILSRLEPETAHDWVTRMLAAAQRTGPAGRSILGAIAGSVPARPVQVLGLEFPNVLGVAAGFDKDARVAAGLAALGFGHVEVGTLTPRPQAGNPKPRVFRLPADRALVNRMGFPNGGVQAALPRLRRLQGRGRGFVLGVSLGKQKETPLDAAMEDYAELMKAVYPHADYLAVNISSPNTPGLRELQGRAFLEELVGRLTTLRGELSDRHRVKPRPLLVKMAPDLTLREVDEMLEVVIAAGIDGVIATNTTLAREGLRDPRAHEQGGLSGSPLAERSNELIRHISKTTHGKLPIIGVGGIMGTDDARAKLEAGASLVQIYTGLVYEGPGLAGTILRDLSRAHSPAEHDRDVQASPP